MQRRFVAHLLLLSLLSFTGLSLTADRVRAYIPTKDYSAVSALCSLFWREFEEPDEVCSNQFEADLYALSSKPSAAQARLYARVLEHDGAVVGFVTYRAPLTHDVDGYDQDNKMAELNYIGVHPDHQGKGYAKMLFDVMRADLKKLGFLTIVSCVSGGNEKALRWHENQGFFKLERGQGDTFLEELKCMNAQSFGFNFMKLRLTPREDEFSEVFGDATVKGSYRGAFQKLLGEMAQTRIVKRVARSFARVPDFTQQQLVKIARHHLILSLDTTKTFAFAAHVLKQKTLSSKIKTALALIFEAVESEMEAEQARMDSDPNYTNTLTFELAQLRPDYIEMFMKANAF